MSQEPTSFIRQECDRIHDEIKRENANDVRILDKLIPAFADAIKEAPIVDVVQPNGTTSPRRLIDDPKKRAKTLYNESEVATNNLLSAIRSKLKQAGIRDQDIPADTRLGRRISGLAEVLKLKTVETSSAFPQAYVPLRDAHEAGVADKFFSCESFPAKSGDLAKLDDPVLCLTVAGIVHESTSHVAEKLRRRGLSVVLSGGKNYCQAKDAAIVWRKWKKIWKDSQRYTGM